MIYAATVHTFQIILYIIKQNIQTTNTNLWSIKGQKDVRWTFKDSNFVELSTIETWDKILINYPKGIKLST